MAETVYRELQIDGARADEKARTAPCVLSTSEPVDRGDGVLEVLVHSDRSVDLSRVPLPLLTNHDSTKLNIGVIEQLRVVGGRLLGVARFGRSEKAKEIFTDVMDRIVQNLSVGYLIFEVEEVGRTLHVKHWMPLEVSAVSVPADHSAGFFRSFRGDTMNDEVKNIDDKPNTRAERRGADQEKTRTECILQLAAAHDLKDFGLECVRNGTDFDQFRTMILHRIEAREASESKNRPFETVTGHQRGPISSGQRQYSLINVMRSLAGYRDVDAGFENEISQELANRSGRNGVKGFLVPLGALQTRDLAKGNTGANLIEDGLMGSQFIDVLRAKSTVLGLGPRILDGLIGDISLPRKTAGTTAYWVSLDGTATITESDVTLDQVSLTMKSLTGYTTASHNVLKQSTPAVEQLLRDDLAQTLATALDRAAIQGSGVSSEPTGVSVQSGIGSVLYTNGGSPTWANVVDLESAIDVDNAATENMAHLTTPTMFATLKKTERATGTASFIVEGNPTGRGSLMNGYSIQSTSNCPSGTVILGDWSQLLIGMWGGLQLDADMYSEFTKGSVRFRAIMDTDLNVRHPESFGALTEAP